MKYKNLDWAALKSQHGSARAIEKATGMNYQTIYWNLKHLGLTSSAKAEHRQKAATIQQESLELKYAELGSADLAGKFFGISEAQVLRRMPERLKEPNRCEKYACNESFFDEDTEASLYVAGFIAADGCLLKKDGKYKQVSLSLEAGDEAIVHKIKELLQFEGPVAKWTAKSKNPKWKDSDKAGVCISSDRLFDTLVERFSLGERKSMTLKFPERLINHPLVHHFLRGYWDGDGTVYVSHQQALPSAYCGIRGTPEFLMEARKILEAHTVAKPRGDRPIRISNGQGTLEYGGNRLTASIRDFLYKNATLFLERKYRLFNSWFVGINQRAPVSSEIIIARSSPIEAINIETGERTLYINLTEIKKEKRFAENGVTDCVKGRRGQHRGFTFKKWPKGSFPDKTSKIISLPNLQAA